MGHTDVADFVHPEFLADTGCGRPGRIAGSVNLPAAHLLNPETDEFLPADALALVMLGHEHVKLYDASVSEWASDPTLPLETG
jgi:thiosulfate/3-mercaptopyruvate sulfurtransferase